MFYTLSGHTAFNPISISWKPHVSNTANSFQGILYSVRGWELLSPWPAVPHSHMADPAIVAVSTGAKPGWPTTLLCVHFDHEGADDTYPTPTHPNEVGILDGPGGS